MAPRLTASQRANVDRINAYVRLIRKQGVRVRKRRGWKRRGGQMFAPLGVLLHDDVSAPGESLGILPLLENGRPDLSGPLYNLWISYGRTLLDRVTGRRSRPTVYVVASGVANHAGSGSWPGKPPTPLGNRHLLAVCLDKRRGEPFHGELRQALDAVLVAVMLHEGWTKGRVAGHKQWTTRKSDPSIHVKRTRTRAALKRKRLTRKPRNGGAKWARKTWRKARKRRGQKP